VVHIFPTGLGRLKFLKFRGMLKKPELLSNPSKSEISANYT
jgi:hypothetical protein